MTDITLYGYTTSPFVRKVAACLYYKQLDFTHIPVNPIAPQDTIGFSGGTQVPILKIGDEWKTDSTPIAHWLDEAFPEHALLPQDAALRKRVIEIDNWVSHMFLPSFFRAAIDGPDTLGFRRRAWRLAQIVSIHTPLPEHIRHRWPDLLRMAPFIQHMVKSLNRDEPLAQMQMRLGMELIGHLGDGPFMGGSVAPTLADLALYPQVIFGYLMGLESELSAAKAPPLRDWIERMSKVLPENTFMIPEEFWVRRLRDALT